MATCLLRHFSYKCKSYIQFPCSLSLIYFPSLTLLPHQISSNLLTYLHTKSILLATHVVFNLHTLITIVWFGFLGWCWGSNQEPCAQQASILPWKHTPNPLKPFIEHLPCARYGFRFFKEVKELVVQPTTQELGQQERALTTKLDLSSIPGTLMAEGENRLPQIAL